MNQEVNHYLAEMIEKGHVKIVGETDGQPIYELTNEGRAEFFKISQEIEETNQPLLNK